MMVKQKANQLIPEQYRGTVYSLGGAIASLLAVFGWANDEQAAAIGVAIIAVLAAILAVIHSRNLWRQAIYLVLAAAGSILTVWGIGSQEEVGAVLGVAAVVLGTQVAAQFTPREEVDALPYPDLHRRDNGADEPKVE